MRKRKRTQHNRFFFFGGVVDIGKDVVVGGRGRGRRRRHRQYNDFFFVGRLVDIH